MSDHTAQIQAMLDRGGDVTVPPGTYNIDAVKSLLPKSGSNITLNDVTLNVIPNSKGSYAVFKLKNVKDVYIVGGKLIGDRKDHGGTDGEWGMGVKISDGAENIFLSRIMSCEMWGDGFYVGAAGDKVAPKDITITGCAADHNRRQGLSIVSVNGCSVTDSVFSRTQGTRPQDGIDVEPDKGCVVNSVIITRNTFTKNAGVNIEFAGKRGKITRVTVKNNNFIDGVPLKVQGNFLQELPFKIGSLFGVYQKEITI